MSGRVRVTLSDGRRVIGYRKTLRRNPRRPLAERLHAINERYRRKFPQGWKPDVRLGFQLPDTIAAFVSDGPHGVGVNVIKGFVQVCNGSSHECFASAAKFFGSVAKGHPSFHVLAVISSASTTEHKFCRYLRVANGEMAVSADEPKVYGAAA